MRKILLIFLFPFLAKSQRIDDRALHVYAGVGISIGISQLLYHHFDRPFRTIPIAFSASCFAGWGKEKWDSREGGTGFSKSDLNHTIWGGAIGTICNVTIIDLRIKRENKSHEIYEARY